VTALIEKSLHQEIMLRLRILPVLAFSVPNQVYIPARNEDERVLARRLIAQMKNTGQLSPGAPDLCVFWGGAGGCAPSGGMIELKRPASRDLLGKRTPAGRPSEAQRELAARAEALGCNHAYASSWEDVRACLVDWGAL